MGKPDEEAEGPVETFEDIPDIGIVKLEDALGPDEALEAVAVVLTDTIGLEETAVPEVVGELEKPLEVGRGDVGMLVVVGLGLLEAGTVVALTGEGSTVAVVV